MNEELASRILYCDGNCIVVNKIAGEVVEGAGKGMIDLPRQIAGSQLNSQFEPDGRTAVGLLDLPVAVHRLDVPVSGCAVFARTNKALLFLNAAFRDSTANNGASGSLIEKKYWAIAEMPQKIPEPLAPAADCAELTHWIQFDAKKNKSIAYNEPGSGRKKAVMRCRIIGKGTHYLFLEIDLLTGRHHQIRAQLGQLGLHVKGDLKYGARRSEPEGGIRLHARSISFPSPTGGPTGNPTDDGKRITVQAVPPLRDNLWLAFEDAAANTKH